MIDFIIVTHGEFGAYLVEAAEAIVGRQEKGVRVISVSPRLSVMEIRQRIRQALQELRSRDGLVVFTDMPGGTPANIAFPLIKDLPRHEMISGVNLYMLISAFSQRKELPLERLVEKTMRDAERSIKNVRQLLAAGAAGRP